MFLRFQKEDDVDREVKEENRRTVPWMILFYIGLIAGVFGLSDFLISKLPKSLWEELGVLFAIGFLCWLVVPVYEEFRIRTKEIYGKVSAIEEAVVSAREVHAELLERLTAVEDRLAEMQNSNRT
ncbi:MAG: hypothetical protein ABSC48_08010 [Terracidiphilus sp.]